MNTITFDFNPIPKLKKLFNTDITPHAAIAFDWMPEKGAPEIINLSIAIARVSKDRLDLDKYSFSVKFPENSVSARDKGVSEIVGLIPKTSPYYEETKSAFFERDLADLLVACIYKLLEEGERCIILQGPLFPKLVGRLGYRYLTEDVVLGALTFHPLWFAQSSTSLIPEMKGKTSFTSFKLGNEEELRISESKSNNGLTEVFKTWTIFKYRSGKDGEKEVCYILDIFCQFPYNDEQILTWEQRIEKIENTFSSRGLILFEGNEIWLPFGLALAWEECRGERETPIKHLSHLRGFLRPFEKDVPEMYSSKKFNSAEIVYLRTFLERCNGNKKLRDSAIRKIKESIPSSYAGRTDDYDSLVSAWKSKCGGVKCWKEILNLEV